MLSFDAFGELPFALDVRLRGAPYPGGTPPTSANEPYDTRLTPVLHARREAMLRRATRGGR